MVGAMIFHQRGAPIGTIPAIKTGAAFSILYGSGITKIQLAGFDHDSFERVSADLSGFLWVLRHL